jgi:diguanylate cyclase (GGDEF)-like protein
VPNTDDAHEARSFEILLRSPADIVVLRNAPWWTAAHAAWVVGVLAALVLLMFAWVAVVRRQASLQTLAVSDPLTGLYNRRGFLLLAEQQWRLAQRGDRQFLLFYIDVDRFKEINDSFGHKEGDAALQTVANVLHESFRKADILGRLGGDEFAVAAIDAALESQMTLEKRLIHILEQHNLMAERKYHLALSVGVLSCDKALGDLSIEELITRADALMYQEKRERQSQQ